MQRRAAGWGVEWASPEAALAALREEVGELSDASDDAEREIGEVLFAAVAAARKLGVDAESALRRTTRGFAERYERLLAARAGAWPRPGVSLRARGRRGIPRGSATARPLDQAARERGELPHAAVSGV